MWDGYSGYSTSGMGSEGYTGAEMSGDEWRLSIHSMRLDKKKSSWREKRAKIQIACRCRVSTRVCAVCQVCRDDVGGERDGGLRPLRPVRLVKCQHQDLKGYEEERRRSERGSCVNRRRMLKISAMNEHHQLSNSQTLLSLT